MDDSTGLTPQHIEELKKYSSSNYGLIDLDSAVTVDEDCTINLQELLRKGIKHYQMLANDASSADVSPDVFNMLGHLHLLLGEFSDALSAYQHYAKATPELAQDSLYLYGSGLVYFHYNAFQWSQESFKRLLLFDPKFPQTKEVNVRLGVMYKWKGEFAASLECFMEALSDTSNCTMPSPNIQYHIGHIHSIQGRYKFAKEVYDLILASKNLSCSVKSMTLREMGWLIHNVPDLAQGEYHEMKAIELLRKSLSINESCGKTWYYLGRVLASVCCIHDAFMAYRKAVARPGAQADTWCAIGVLYQQQGQPVDSLQAYISAVYLDPKHIASWTDMGLLYEAMEQPIDAYICYQNAVNTRALSDKAMKLVLPKAQHLHCFISSNRQQLTCAQRFLPSVKQAWMDLVPSSVKSKVCHKEIPLLYIPGLDHLPGFNPYHTGVAMAPYMPSTWFGCYNVAKYGIGSPGRKCKNGKGKVPKEPIILPSVMGMQDPGLMGMPMGQLCGVQPTSVSDVQLQNSNPVPQNLNPMPIPPPQPTALPPYGQVQSDSPSLPGFSGANGNGNYSGSSTNTIHYGSQFYDNRYNQHPIPIDPTTNPLPIDFPSNRMAMHLNDSQFNRYLSNASLDQVSLDKELPDLGQLNSPLFSDASYNHNVMHGLFSPSTDLANSQSPFTPMTDCVSSSTEADRKRPNCLDVMPNSKHRRVVRNIPTPHSLEMTGGIDIFSGQTTPQSSTSTAASSSTPDSCIVPPIGNPAVPYDHLLKSTCEPLDILSGASCSSAEYWGNFDGIDPSISSDDLLNENNNIVPFIPSNQDSSTSIGPGKNGTLAKGLPIGSDNDKDSSIVSPPTTDISTLTNVGSVQDKNESLVATSPFQFNRCSESFPVESIENFELTDDNVFPPLEDTDQSSQDAPDLQHSTQESAESMSDSSPIKIRGSILSSSGSQPIPRARFLSSQCSDAFEHLPTPLSVSSRFSCPSESGRANEKIIPITVPNIPAEIVAPEYMKPNPLSPPSPPPVDIDINLFPDVPVIEASSFEEALSQELHNRCLDPRIPICLIRGVTNAVGFDLTQFSSKTLVKTYGVQPMEVREQMLQTSDENWDSSGKRQIWRCESSRSNTTIEEYAVYQGSADWNVTDSDIINSPPQDEDAGYFSSCSKKSKSRRILRFATNGDLSDATRWHTQLAEIEKLPKFLRVQCPEANLLNHIGHTVLGMNTVQLYLKVPGSRTTGHQENNNFCSVNINIGPGKCEWYCTASQYWGMFHKLCEKHRVTFLRGSWWPILKELELHNIPVYRFDQLPGDVVWINPGSVHWVQANEVCNNIAWNVGPITPHQFRMCWERYEWNKVQKEQSIVPAVLMAWNLAKSLKITDPELHSSILSILENSYDQNKKLLGELISNKVPIHWHGREDNEPAPYCNSCSDEVFNILFVVKKKSVHHVYCYNCASQFSKKRRYVVLQQYALWELEEIIENFQLNLDATKQC